MYSGHVAPIGATVCFPDLIHSWAWAAFWVAVGIATVIGVAGSLMAIAGRPPRADDAAVPLLPARDEEKQQSLPRRPRIDALDGWRTVLVTYIISHNSYPDNGLSAIFHKGLFPIPFFFVLSGFVHCYVAEEKRQYFDLSAGAGFVARRFARLAPAYWIALLATFALAYANVLPAEAGRPLITWPLQAALVQSLVPMKICGPGEHSWSNYLQFEGNNPGWFTSAVLLCSLCFPVLFNAGPHDRWMLTLAALVAVCILRSVPAFAQEYFPIYGEGLDLFSFAPLRMFDIFAGMLSARLCSQLPEACRFWRGWAFVPDSCLVAVLFLTYVWVIPPLAIGIRGEKGHPAHGDYMCTIVFCAACMGYRLSLSPEPEGEGAHSWSPLVSHGVSGSVLSWWPLAKMADYSFSAYIVQYPLWLVIPKSSIQPWLSGFLHVMACWGVGAIITHTVERPVLRAFEQRLESQRK